MESKEKKETMINKKKRANDATRKGRKIENWAHISFKILIKFKINNNSSSNNNDNCNFHFVPVLLKIPFPVMAHV